MNKIDFVTNVRKYKRKSAIDAIIGGLHKPAGRKPHEKDIKLSKWFNALTENDKEMVRALVESSVDHPLFGFLCILDGASAIESGPDKGQLELRYVKGASSVLLNDDESAGMHEYYFVVD